MNDGKLGEKAHKIIRNPNNLIFVRAASFWEFSVKLN